MTSANFFSEYYLLRNYFFAAKFSPNLKPEKKNQKKKKTEKGKFTVERKVSKFETKDLRINN